ncbi:MAG: hypothetical protein H6703_13045 [Myxococcales bacterium]|nr:hypothetical protein [Myxococcales bacterium]MCB9543359.1 hypothetical protein [Myxococcales bacterium]
MSWSPLTAIRLYTATAGLAAIALTVWLVPLLAGRHAPGADWQLGYALVTGATTLIGVWRIGALLATLPAQPTADPHHRRLAHDFPVRLARSAFVGAVLCGVGTGAWLAHRGQPLGAAIATGAITYVVALLPVLGLYLVTRRLLRAHAAGPPGSGPVLGLRQPVAGRLALAVQMPVAVCAAGLLLVQQSGGEAYGLDTTTYFVERTRTLQRRLAARLPDDAARAALTAALPAARRGNDPPTDIDPALALGWLPFTLFGALLALTAIGARRLAEAATDDLDAIGDALRRIDEDEPPPPPPVALRETAAVAAALQRTLHGLAAQRAALRRAAAERRKADAAKARFLAHLSHELKSPLNSILGFAELLLAEIDGPLEDRQRTRLGILWRSGESLLRFILALLDLSRLEGLRDPAAAAVRITGFTPSPNRLDDLARVLATQLRPDPLALAAVTITPAPPPAGEPPRARFDPVHTARALYLAAGGLLDALEAGEVEIALAHRDGVFECRIRVIAADGEVSERPALVERWRRADADARDPERAAAADLRGAPILLLHRLCAVQGGAVALTRLEPWPELVLTLPVEAT